MRAEDVLAVLLERRLERRDRRRARLRSQTRPNGVRLTHVAPSARASSSVRAVGRAAVAACPGGARSRSGRSSSRARRPPRVAPRLLAAGPRASRCRRARPRAPRRRPAAAAASERRGADERPGGPLATRIARRSLQPIRRSRESARRRPGVPGKPTPPAAILHRSLHAPGAAARVPGALEDVQRRMKRLIAIGFIWLGCAIAWVILGSRWSSSLGRGVVGDHPGRAEALGPYRCSNAAPRARPAAARAGPGRPVPRPRRAARAGRATDARSAPSRRRPRSTASDIAVRLALTHRQKGLLWFPTYEVDFAASYAFANEARGRRRLTLEFPLVPGEVVLRRIRGLDEHGRLST